jgi:hypothetical protein
VLPFLLCAIFLLVILPLLIRNCGMLFAVIADDRSFYSEAMAHFQEDQTFSHLVETKMRLVDIAQLFNTYDEQNSGRLSAEVFEAGIQQHGVFFSGGDFEQAMLLLDPNRTGFIERDAMYEFTVSGTTQRQMSRHQRFDQYTDAVQSKLSGLGTSVKQLNSLLQRRQ